MSPETGVTILYYILYEVVYNQILLNNSELKQSLSDTGWFVESCDAIAFVMAFSSTLATLGLLQPWALRFLSRM